MFPKRPPLNRLASTSYDVLIIGGGINGAGIARDATLRGYRVALFEQADFASGTSSRSSKLVHGGIRYLEQGRFPLVFEASLERQILLRIAPHLVRPLPFLFPVYRGARWGKFLLDIGMWLYDLLSLFRNIRRHRMLSRKDTLRLEPDLLPDGLTGAGLFYDGQMDDARLCLANVLEAREEGAAVRNYTRVTGLLKNGEGRVGGIRIRDGITGEEESVMGSVVVNATGPWVDEIDRMETPDAVAKLRKTRGSHLILPALTHDHALVIRSAKDDRVLFVIPWEGMSLVGTTDIDFDGDPGDVHCPPADFEYLLNEARRYFPKRNLTPDQVIATFAGVRPLVHSDRASASQVSREEKIDESPSGLISVTGGKFTTYRKVAETVVNRIGRRLPGVPVESCSTRNRPLWGGETGNIDRYIDDRIPELNRRHSLDAVQTRHLVMAYGTRYLDLLELLSENTDLKERLHPSLPHLKAEVVHAVREESAVTLADVLRRRTKIALGPYRTHKRLIDNAVGLMASELGWSVPEAEKQERDYLREIS
jgi:glycerol-3-phosphate dehydrogenase